MREIELKGGMEGGGDRKKLRWRGGETTSEQGWEGECVGGSDEGEMEGGRGRERGCERC